MIDSALAELPAPRSGNRPIVGVIGADEMPAALYARLHELFGDAVHADKLLHDLRLVRHSDEIALHRHAACISDAMIQRAMLLATAPGMTPARLMAEVEFTGRSMGADTATLWLATGREPPVTCFDFSELAPGIYPGDRVQLGTQVTYQGHFAQGIRMGIRGEPSRELSDCAKLLLDMQDATLAELVPGRPLHRVVDTLESLIDAHCPFDRQNDPFRFQSCHGMGMDYSEPAMTDALSPNRDRSKDGDGPCVAENMVFEIHPNFTLPGLGHVCTGDVAVATPRGGEWLTRFPRGLVALG